MPDASALAFHFALGVGAFFSPCGYPMLPAYLSYYLPRVDGERPSAAGALARGLGGGLLAALGALVVLLAVGALAVAVGAPFKRNVHWLELGGGLLVLALGVALLAGRAPSVRVPLRPSQRRGAAGLALFGGLYAMVAAGCVAPLLVSTLAAAAAAPTALDGMLVVLAYASGLGAMLVGATLAVATAQETLLKRARAVLPHVERASGALLVLVGLYLVWYWAGVEFGVSVPQLPNPFLR